MKAATEAKKAAAAEKKAEKQEKKTEKNQYYVISAHQIAEVNAANNGEPSKKKFSRAKQKLTPHPSMKRQKQHQKNRRWRRRWQSDERTRCTNKGYRTTPVRRRGGRRGTGGRG